jgi:putative DNA primase/helicase
LTARVDEQVVFFLHGGGQNGKSTFVAALDALLGEYATNAGKETFLASLKNEGRGPEPELMRLSGKRFAYVNEADEGRALDEARIKALTGGATTTARDLYKTTETFTNTAKVWFDLNTLPAFKGIDYGIERRLVVIPFDWKVPDIGRVGDMAEQLKAELPGILAWAVDGCRRWRLSGLQQRPAGVAVATRRYRDENNHLPAFVEETYMLTPDGTVTVADLQRDYAGFCERRGETALAYKQKMIPYLRDVLGLEPSKTKVARLWRGIASRPAE